MSQRRFLTYSALLHSLLALLTAALLFVGHQNRQWKEILADAFPNDKIPAVGNPFVGLDITTTDNQPAAWGIKTADRPTVLFLFSANCASCETHVDAWLDLYDQFGDEYRFLGIGLDPTAQVADFVERSKLPFPAVVPKDPRLFQQLNGIHAVPQTLLVSPRGSVSRHHAGRIYSDFLASPEPAG